MYATYNDDKAFEAMFKKKEIETKILFAKLKGLPTQGQVRKILAELNSHPDEVLKINALLEVCMTCLCMYVRNISQHP